jgi:hypothetical protein
MVLFFGQDCPLCGVPMSEDDHLFATSHFIADPDHDLWRFSDACMHWHCYATWAHRRRFARLYFEAKVEWSGRNPYWGVVHRDDRILVTVNPRKTVGEIDVPLSETGSSFRIDLCDWEDWLRGDWFDGGHHEVEREALADVIPLLRSNLPSVEVVISRSGLMNLPESEDASGAGMVARISHEFACRKLTGRVMTKGIACPHCGAFSNEHRFVGVGRLSDDGAQSHLICCVCGEQFGPTDV